MFAVLIGYYNITFISTVLIGYYNITLPRVFRVYVIGEGVGIRHLYPITDTRFIFVNIILSKI